MKIKIAKILEAGRYRTHIGLIDEISIKNEEKKLILLYTYLPLKGLSHEDYRHTPFESYLFKDWTLIIKSLQY